jgi:hypothetical protein
MSKMIKIVVGMAVVIAIIAVAFSFYSNSGMVGAAKSQLKLIRAGKVDAAYQMTSKNFQNDTSLERFKAFAKQYDVFNDNKSVRFSDKKEEGNNGYLKGVITSSDGGEMVIEYILLKEEGQWKIEAIRLTPLNAPSPPSS